MPYVERLAEDQSSLARLLAMMGVMDSEQAQESVERDQLWASLRALRQEIDQLAAGKMTSSERERQMVVLLARVVATEMDFREREGIAD